ncbi:MAG: RNA-binding S4 domain-containing protein [Candidatus Obscuribacterales bacterium]|nr:RNA-binding S4 domain-containing protein [Candidatus Obscuribacterales bacterium]
MRLDKWLKLSRLIKRRTIAQMACEQGRIFINDRTAKSATSLKPGDKLHIELGSRALTVEVVELPLRAPSIQDAAKIYKILEEVRRPKDTHEDLGDEWN